MDEWLQEKMPNVENSGTFIVYRHSKHTHGPTALFLRSCVCLSLSRSKDFATITERFTKSCIFCNEDSMDSLKLNAVLWIVRCMDLNSMAHAHFMGQKIDMTEVLKLMMSRTFAKVDPSWWINKRNRLPESAIRALLTQSDEDILHMAPRGI